MNQHVSMAPAAAEPAPLLRNERPSDFAFQLEARRALRHSRDELPVLDQGFAVIVEKVGALALAIRTGGAVTAAAIAVSVIAHRLAVEDGR